MTTQLTLPQLHLLKANVEAELDLLTARLVYLREQIRKAEAREAALEDPRR